MKISLFIPCYIDQLYPDTAFNTVKILEKAGCKVDYNPDQTCCGQPAYNSGYWDETRDLARKFLGDFDKGLPIVSPSGSCTGFIKNHYPKLFKDEISTSVAVKSLKVFELSDFLVNTLKVTKLGAKFPHKVTFHDSCHALREYGLTDEARTLLNNVEGLELIEMEDSETCCGFGGTFSAKYSEVSAAMADQKVEQALATGVEYMITTEASCLMNINGYAAKNNKPIKCIHLADVLASGL